MRRPTASVSLIADPITDAPSEPQGNGQTSPTTAALHSSEFALARCRALYVEGWQQVDRGQLDRAQRAFQELLIWSRHCGHSGWTNAAEKAMATLVAQTALATATQTIKTAASATTLPSSQRCDEADALYAQGQISLAKTTYQQALEAAVQEQCLLNIGRCLNGLGLIDLDRRRYVQAETEFQAAIEVLADVEAPRQSAIAFHNLALVHYQQGDHAAAKVEFQQALDFWQTGEDSLDLALTLDYLGRIYADEQAYWLALGSFEAAVDILVELTPHQDVRLEAAALMVQMAQLCEHTRHLDLAIAYLTAALETYQTLPLSQPLLTVLNRLGRLHQQAQRPAIARHYYQRAQRVAQCEGGKADLPDTAYQM
ncbi:MAG: tetratricopeptide repeat protein [Leptolyngbyaceae cyanobacterium]